MICVSLSGLPFGDCVNIINLSEYAEIRIDLLDLSQDQLKGLFSLKKRTIATCRSGKYTEEQQLALLKMAIIAGATYVDVDYDSPANFREELTNFAHSNHTHVIISYHNFIYTPSQDYLEIIINQSKNWNADRVKIVTTAINKSDCSTVIGLYARHNNIIAFCMGETGKITRLAAPLLGADFTFASWNDTLATAPGQLTVDELTTIYNIIEKKIKL